MSDMFVVFVSIISEIMMMNYQQTLDAGLEITTSDSRFYHRSAESVIAEPDPNIVVAKANGCQHLPSL